MKLTHINIGPSAREGGGTAVAAMRLHQQLRKYQIDSRMLVGYINQSYPQVSQISRPKWLRPFEGLARRVLPSLGFNELHNFSSFFLNHNPTIRHADLLHLHCMHEGYFNTLALPLLTAEKPAVYTMHDIWAFTGHCSMDLGCDRWKRGCGNCPDLSIAPAVRRDTTRLEWRMKQWAYENSRLSIISPSTWMTQQLQQSTLKHLPIYQIPHGVDLNLLQPYDPLFCRAALNIPDHKKVLMFAGSGPRTSFYKGGDLLMKALELLPKSLKNELVLLVMGDVEPSFAKVLDIEICLTGTIEQDSHKAIAYSAADLFLFPSRAESFGLVALESLACMTPVVAFAVGGIPDLVRSEQTGYLAQPENPRDFKQGILELLEDSQLRHRMAQQARRMAVEEFSIELSTQRHLRVYEQILGIRPEIKTQPTPVPQC